MQLYLALYCMQQVELLVENKQRRNTEMIDITKPTTIFNHLKNSTARDMETVIVIGRRTGKTTLLKALTSLQERSNENKKQKVLRTMPCMDQDTKIVQG